MNTKIFELKSQGRTLDASPQSFGELRDSSDAVGNFSVLRSRMEEDGYLFLRGYLDQQKVRAVREEWLTRLEAAGVLHPDTEKEMAIPAAQPPAFPAQNLVKENQALRDVVFGEQMFELYRGFFGTEMRHFDHIWARTVPPGIGTPPHADAVYMNRGTPNLFTAWIPYSNATKELGGLMILEGSHKQQARLRQYLESDVDTYCENRAPYKHKKGWLSNNPVSLREKLGGRWLTTDFQMGDLLTFKMTTVHASLDNQSQEFRFSSDTRYQSANEPIDPRWVGPDTVEYGERNRIGKIC